MLLFGFPILTVSSHDPIAINVIDLLEKKTLVRDSPLLWVLHCGHLFIYHKSWLDPQS
jgi:hypothetical protein